MKYNLLINLFFIASLSLTAQAEYGKASFYADKFQGNKTANGDRFDQKKFTAAHRTLPFNTFVKVTNLNNQKSVTVRINDRGPFVKGVVIDLSKAAARQLDMIQAGVVNVKMEIVNAPSKTSPPKQTISLGNSTPSAEQPKKPVPTVSLGTPKPRIGKSTNLFSVEVKELALEKYGIQVGSYSQYQNILKQINRLQVKTQKNSMIFVGKSSDGHALYKLIVGPFPNKTTAEGYLVTLKGKSINGFVVDLSNLK